MAITTPISQWPTIKEMVAKLNAGHFEGTVSINDWEEGFLVSMQAKDTFSQKMQAKIVSIYDREIGI